jgi:hypothetical protein
VGACAQPAKIALPAISPSSNSLEGENTFVAMFIDPTSMDDMLNTPI